MKTARTWIAAFFTLGAVMLIPTGTAQATTYRCMDVRNGSAADYTPVQVYSCNGTPAQTWVIYGNGFRNPQSGKCVDGSDMSNGHGLFIYPCNGSSAQNLKVYISGSWSDIWNPPTNRCVDGNNKSIGRQLVIYNCNGTPAQNWQFVGSTVRSPV